MRKFTPAAVLKECEARAELASWMQVARWENIIHDKRATGNEIHILGR